MAGTEPLPLMDQAMCQRIIETTNGYLQHVQWKSNCTPDSLFAAVQEAKKGNDGGLELTLALRPKNRVFEDWMNWSALVTFLFNRDTQVRTLLSAIRNAINDCIETHVIHNLCIYCIYYSIYKK